MAYLLDYSAAKLTGPVIKAAGYTGVIRYIDAPSEVGRKHTNVAEWLSITASGLTGLLVMQTTTTASDGGRPVGIDHARRALAGANLLGYTGPVFFTNDRTTVPNPAAWRAYLDGAASVLGMARVGAYGFANAIDLALGHASFFWQAGRRSDVRPHTHLWQDNNTQVTVAGVLCDRNLILKPIEEDDMTPEDLLNFPVPRTGSVLGGNITLKAMLANWDQAIEREATRDKALAAAVAALSDDPSLDRAAIGEIFDVVVKAHTPTAEQNAEAQRPFLEDLVRSSVPAEQADAIVDELVSRLANPIPEGN
jgi:hypothetical protein